MWTYSGDPSDSPVDEVHLLCGDTDPEDGLLQDEEIEVLLALYPKPEGKPAYLAAAAGCDAIAARFGRQIDRSLGAINTTASQMYNHYRELAQQYRIAYATDGKGIVEGHSVSPVVLGTGANMVLGTPILGGGGTTVLGSNELTSGGGGA